MVKLTGTSISLSSYECAGSFWFAGNLEQKIDLGSDLENIKTEKAPRGSEMANSREESRTDLRKRHYFISLLLQGSVVSKVLTSSTLSGKHSGQRNCHL